MMYDENFGYVIGGGTHSIAYRVAREGYERKMRERERVLKDVRDNPYSFINFDYIWRDDKQVALEAILMDGMLLEYASEDLKRDEEVVKCAIDSNIFSIRFAGNNIKDSDSIMIDLVSRNGLLLEYASPRIRKQKAICMSAVINDGRAIYYVDDTLKGDRDIVLSSIRQNGSLILMAPKKYLSDKEAVIAAVSQKSKSYLLMGVDKKFLDDIDVILSSYIYDKNALKYASDFVKDQIRIITIKNEIDCLLETWNEMKKVKKI